MLFFVPISVFRRKGISNGTKPSRGSFLEQTQSRRLGVDVKEETRQPRGRRARPRGRRAPTLVGPSWLHQPTSFAYIYSYTPKTSREPTKNNFHRHNLLYPQDPILEPSPVLRRRGSRPRRASHHLQGIFDELCVVYHRPSGP